MKYLLLLMFMVGCDEAAIKKIEKLVEETPIASQTIVIEKPIEVTKQKMTLAWGDAHPDWDKALYAELATLPNVELKKPCKKLSTKDCAAQLLSIMAKYESNFKPETSYKEGFNDSKGSAVISRGLLQISQESANQSAYLCNIKKAEDLHKADVNLKCAVKILAYQARKSGTLMGEPKKGCSAYWSVCRVSSGSYSKIIKYMEQY